jgi:rsbT co-antagonist protein RsbR
MRIRVKEDRYNKRWKAMSNGTNLTGLDVQGVDWQPTEILHRAIDTFTDPIFIKDRRHVWIAANQAFFNLFNRPGTEILGKSDPDFFPPDQVEMFWRGDDELFASGQPSENEERLTGADGVVRLIWTRKYPIFDDSGQCRALSGIITDVTRIRGTIEKAVRLEAEVEEQQRIIAAQNQLLSQLVVPVIRIWEGILLVPLIGEITAARAMQIMDSVLNAISQQQAQFILLDITGMTVLDAKVAGYLIQTVQATRLLGCQSIMVGIAASVAAQLVRLGADFSTLNTMSTLQQGLELAIKRLSLAVPGRRK